VTDAARADAYADYLERTGARAAGDPGSGVYVCGASSWSRRFTFISLWESIDAIRRFAGMITKRHLLSEDRDFSSSSNPSSSTTTSHRSLASTLRQRVGGSAPRHRMVDEMLEYLRTRASARLAPGPAEVRERLTGPSARADAGWRVYEQFKRDVLPYPTGNTPRFWDG